MQGISVQKFLKEVNEIQYESDSALLQLADHMNMLAGDPEQVTEAVRLLENDRDTIREAQSRMINLDAPQGAENIRNDMIDLYESGIETLNELIIAGEYSIASQPILEEYESASESFSQKINDSTTTDQLIQTIKDFTIIVLNSSNELETLEIPSMYENSHMRFINNLDTLAQGLDEMVTGIENYDVTVIEAANNKIDAVSSNNFELAESFSKDRVADIKAYNDKIRHMSDMMKQIRLDEADLKREFETDNT